MFEKKMKDLAWNTFKQTGNIDTFMEFMKFEDIEKNKRENQLDSIEEETQYGNYQSKGYHSFRK